MVDQEGENHGWDQEELYSEGVMVVIVCSTEAHVHQVNGAIRSEEKDHLQKIFENINKNCSFNLL